MRANGECYVSTNGNDEVNCGLLDNPCLSFAQCIENCESDCKIISELILGTSSAGNSGMLFHFSHTRLQCINQID